MIHILRAVITDVRAQACVALTSSVTHNTLITSADTTSATRSVVVLLTDGTACSSYKAGTLAKSVGAT